MPKLQMTIGKKNSLCGLYSLKIIMYIGRVSLAKMSATVTDYVLALATFVGVHK